MFRTPLFAKAGEYITGRCVMKANKRQSYDIEIEAMVEETGCKSDNYLDLKNPYFRYNGSTPQVKISEQKLRTMAKNGQKPYDLWHRLMSYYRPKVRFLIQIYF